MAQTHDWLPYAVFSPPHSWPRLMQLLNELLSSETVRDLTALRILEINHLYGSNIRLFVLPAAGKRLSLDEQLQAFFRDSLNGKVVPAMQSIPACDTTVLAIRVLLSDAIMAAFQAEMMDDETLFTMAMYLHVALLQLNRAGTALVQSAPFTNISHYEEEYSLNRDMLDELQSDITHSVELPAWLPIWMAGYKAILNTAPGNTHAAIYRSTVYLIAKQLGLSASLTVKLEYFIRKIIANEFFPS